MEGAQLEDCIAWSAIIFALSADNARNVILVMEDAREEDPVTSASKVAKEVATLDFSTARSSALADEVTYFCCGQRLGSLEVSQGDIGGTPSGANKLNPAKQKLHPLAKMLAGAAVACGFFHHDTGIEMSDILASESGARGLGLHLTMMALCSFSLHVLCRGAERFGTDRCRRIPRPIRVDDGL
jgi:hypothetical protein